MRAYLPVIAACLVLTFSSFAQNILTAKDFDFGWIRKSSGQNAETLKIEINPNLPPITVQLIPDSAVSLRSFTKFRQSVGKIQVFAGNSSAAIQELEIKTYTNASEFIEAFTAKDINFDGYLDIAVMDDFGAKWVRYQWWLFDPKSGKFISNSLTAELLKLSGSDIIINETSNQIETESYINTCLQTETYKISQGHLKQIELKERSCEKNGIRVRLWRRIDGKLQVVKTWREKAYTNSTDTRF